MTSFQKVIKYTAIVLAGGLAIGIFAGIGRLMTSLFGGSSVLDSMQTYTIEGPMYEVNTLEMEISGAEVRIIDWSVWAKDEKVEELKIQVESNVKDLLIELTPNGKLRIIDATKHGNGFGKNTPKVFVYIPSGIEFESIDIEMGAGSFYANLLSAKTISLTLGAGEAQIEYLQSTGKVEIDGGAGKIKIESALVQSLDLDCGVGEVFVGLTGAKSDYFISVEKGIGQVVIDGVKCQNYGQAGENKRKIEIEGGVGKIEIAFVE